MPPDGVAGGPRRRGTRARAPVGHQDVAEHGRSIAGRQRYAGQCGSVAGLPALSAYTGILPGGYVGGHNATVLTSYVNNGGNVYLAGGTGTPGEDSVRDSFLANFGFESGPSCNGISGTFAPSTSHPILAGVPSLYYANGNTVILTGRSPFAQLIAIEPDTGAGLIGIYEASVSGEIPEPSTFLPAGAGLLILAWRLRRSAHS